MPKIGALRSYDGSHFIHFLTVTKRGRSTLTQRSMGDMQGIYMLCLGGGKGMRGYGLHSVRNVKMLGRKLVGLFLEVGLSVPS